MKHFIFINALIISILHSVSAQDIIGSWKGLLKVVQNTELRLVLHIGKSDTNYIATMDIPDQGAQGIKIEMITFKDSILSFKSPKLHMEYKGKWAQGSGIQGKFKQGGFIIPLDLIKDTNVKIEKPLLRPQTPNKPYPYYSEDLVFENKEANIQLAATLSLPEKEGKYPAVILISGSGPQNRDEEILEHKPFLVLADYLTRNGIAVLRYDDRGTAQSTGSFNGATSFDFASDASAAFNYLKYRKEIDPHKIGLIGHSEGGLIAPMVALENGDVDFIILLAAPGLSGGEILLLQQELIARADGIAESTIKQTKEINKAVFKYMREVEDPKELEQIIIALLRSQIEELEAIQNMDDKTIESFLNAQIKRTLDPWMLNFIKYDPIPTLEKLKCSVLALNGEKDLQVPSKENLRAIKKALNKAGNKNISLQELPNLNHLFQECESGSPSEYKDIEQTFSPIALQIISDWIKIQTK